MRQLPRDHHITLLCVCYLSQLLIGSSQPFGLPAGVLLAVLAVSTALQLAVYRLLERRGFPASPFFARLLALLLCFTAGYDFVKADRFYRAVTSQSFSFWWLTGCMLLIGWYAARCGRPTVLRIALPVLALVLASLTGLAFAGGGRLENLLPVRLPRRHWGRAGLVFLEYTFTCEPLLWFYWHTHPAPVAVLPSKGEAPPAHEDGTAEETKSDKRQKGAARPAQENGAVPIQKDGSAPAPKDNTVPATDAQKAATSDTGGIPPTAQNAPGAARAGGWRVAVWLRFGVLAAFAVLAELTLGERFASSPQVFGVLSLVSAGADAGHIGAVYHCIWLMALAVRVCAVCCTLRELCARLLPALAPRRRLLLEGGGLVAAALLWAALWQQDCLVALAAGVLLCLAVLPLAGRGQKPAAKDDG